jgi:hypothetical protein
MQMASGSRKDCLPLAEGSIATTISSLLFCEIDFSVLCNWYYVVE